MYVIQKALTISENDPYGCMQTRTQLKYIDQQQMHTNERSRGHRSDQTKQTGHGPKQDREQERWENYRFFITGMTQQRVDPFGHLNSSSRSSFSRTLMLNPSVLGV
jgi:hypothetical protein